MGGEALVRLSAVVKCYPQATGNRRVLDGVELAVGEGELVVVIGRSGSGKSTLLHLLGAIDRPSEGEVWVAGQPLHELSEDDRSRFRLHHVGFVFQAFNLLPTLTVEENLLLPLELLGTPFGAAIERARSLLADVGLADRADDFPDQLSGGEQQRVAVARALVHRPRLVLADEPTGNLDLETGRQVVELLDRLTRRAGRTLIMATHSPEVVGHADRLLAVRDGRLIEGAAG